MLDNLSYTLFKLLRSWTGVSSELYTWMLSDGLRYSCELQYGKNRLTSKVSLNILTYIVFTEYHWIKLPNESIDKVQALEGEI